MKELIPIAQTEFKGVQKRTVDARALHEKLEVAQKFANWLPHRISHYSFTEGKDFFTFPGNEETAPVERGRPTIEYALTVGMAKELCMLENNEIGRKFRRYFIDCEEELVKRLEADALKGRKAIEENKALAKDVKIYKTKSDTLLKQIEFEQTALMMYKRPYVAGSVMPNELVKITKKEFGVAYESSQICDFMVDLDLLLEKGFHYYAHPKGMKAGYMCVKEELSGKKLKEFPYVTPEGVEYVMSFLRYIKARRD
jgi:phage anti-repressor protein